MIPFLGNDLTFDKHNEQLQGKEWLVATLSPATNQLLEQAAEKEDKQDEAAKLPLALRIGQGLCGFVGFIVVIGILRADVSIVEGYQNAPWLYWLGGGCVALWLILRVFANQKKKAVLSTEESSRLAAYVSQVQRTALQELKVPADSKEIDILSFSYKQNGENIKTVSPFWNAPFHCFGDEENLYVASVSEKYAIPRSCILGIRTINKAILLPNWNKRLATDEGIYKQFKISQNNNGLQCKPYHILEFQKDGKLWGLYFPCYELPALEAIIGKQKAL